jgi:hypothetical protein
MTINKLRQNIYDFFEQPKGVFGIGFQVMSFLMIIASVVIAFLEFFRHDVAAPYEPQLLFANHIILAVFTVEYVLRLASAPNRLQFVKRPTSIIDFLAIFPNYIELFLHIFVDTTELRALRLVRLLRFTRVLRLFKLFKYGPFLKRIFQFQETVLEAIFPIVTLFLALKGVIWILESNNLWISNADLGNLFAIIGFALGIILSQKIGVSYDKFLQVDEAIIRIAGNLQSLELILGKKSARLVASWAKTFLALLVNPTSDNFSMRMADAKLYRGILAINKVPGESITGLYLDVSRDGAFCLSKKIRLAPKAYDMLLQQATMLYLALVAVFIPGITGIISILTATYILYGMYYLTQDLDSIFGGDYSLINVNLSELNQLVTN